MHKVDANMEAGGPPPANIIKDMGQLVQGSLKSGIFKNGAGLHRSAMRVRLEIAGETRTVTKGPLSGKNELVASCVMVRAPSMDAAIELAERFAKIWGDSEIQIGPVVEPWDLGVVPKPAGDLPGRFLILQMSTPDAERGVAPSAATRQALEQLKKGLKAEGILLAAEDLAPSATGARLSGPKGKREWTDGPFTEAKELIAGFSILELPSKKDAIAWADRYAAILVDNEIDVRETRDAMPQA
jgi:hypothetical protein